MQVSSDTLLPPSSACKIDGPIFYLLHEVTVIGNRDIRTEPLLSLVIVVLATLTSGTPHGNVFSFKGTYGLRHVPPLPEPKLNCLPVIRTSDTEHHLISILLTYYIASLKLYGGAVFTRCKVSQCDGQLKPFANGFTEQSPSSCSPKCPQGF